MIKLQNLTKYYQSKLGKQYVFDRLNFDIPADHNIGILGSNGAGKSTLFRLLAGSEYPNSGRIITELSLSWPVALNTGIHPLMTGQENARFIGKINGIDDVEEYEQRVKVFSGLGNKFYLPVRSYSSGMRPRLAFACSVCIDFDVYLIDEVSSVGDANFKRKAKQALLERSKQASIIMVSHDMNEIKFFCDSAIVLQKGKLTFYNDLEEGIKEYESL